MKADIYLDIDGVLITSGSRPANYASEFIDYVLKNYPETTYWLTTHCNGDASKPIKNIGHLFDNKTVEYMKQIKPTSWDTAKTRAIDMSRPFLWFDDNLFFEEKQTLIDNNLLDSWIEVNLTNNPDQLVDFISDFPIPINQ